jgi:hypothetical protein
MRMATPSSARRTGLPIAVVRRSPLPHLLALAAAVAASLAPTARIAAQSIDDGLTLPARTFRTTVDYGVDKWSDYWEGTLKRDNQNIGTLTTTSTTWMGSYGVTKNLNVYATLPYVRTEASQGVLMGMSGAQDVTLAAKYRFARIPLGGGYVLGATALLGVGAPTTDYTPDFLPMSIGLASKRATLRTALHVKERHGLFADATTAYTWRSTVKLNRPAYYTDGQLVSSNEVAMPDVYDWTAGVGYNDATWCIPLMLMGQRTLGGGDIRRQDMPFVSNRMDFLRVGAKVMYMVPALPQLGVSVGAAHTLAGRNVGQSTMYSVGLISAFRL